MKHILVTNDDGIDSYFLHELIHALKNEFKISIAAPLAEQSWIGRAISRNRTVNIVECKDLDCEAWAIDGTPSDCVNIALGHLLKNKPDCVVSGINIKSNVTVPLLLSSGTIAGAIEGASWEIPSLAFSQHVPKIKSIAGIIQKSHGKCDDATINNSVKLAAKHATDYIKRFLTQKHNFLSVKNINYPILESLDVEEVETKPAHMQLGCLFERTSENSFEFLYPDTVTLKEELNTDIHILSEGKISISTLDISAYGR